MPEIQVHPDVSALSRDAAERIVRAAEEAIAAGTGAGAAGTGAGAGAGRFSIALAGGSTPRATYQLLASPAFAPRIDWAKVEIFFGDERCVPPDHVDSNYRMAREALLSAVPIPGDNVYRMRGEIDPETAAKEYGQMLKEKFGDDGGIDLMLLGLGEDGHTASLFPRTPALRETRHRCVAQFVEHSTTGASWRLTLTPPFINRSRNVLFMAAGANKAEALQRVLEGPADPENLPAQLIAPRHGKVTWLIDAAAAAMQE